MFLGQAMEITETDCSKQYMLVEQFANFSKVGWFTAADPIYNLGDFFLIFFIEKMLQNTLSILGVHQRRNMSIK